MGGNKKRGGLSTDSSAIDWYKGWARANPWERKSMDNVVVAVGKIYDLQNENSVYNEQVQLYQRRYTEGQETAKQITNINALSK